MDRINKKSISLSASKYLNETGGKDRRRSGQAGRQKKKVGIFVKRKGLRGEEKYRNKDILF